MNALLLSALIQVESAGNDYARGRHGELGALQIRPVMVRDVNRIMGTSYGHSQMTNRAISTWVVSVYLDHYGKNLSDESLARIHNGGPRGHLKSSTRAYARRVRKELDKQLVTINKTIKK